MKRLEALGVSLFCPVAFCERRVLDRVIVDERRLDQFLLDHVLEEIHEELALALWLVRFLESVLHGKRPEFIDRMCKDVDPGVLLYRVLHREPAQRLLKRDRGLLELNLVRAVDLLCEGCKEVLGEVHHVVDIVVRPVDLHHRELGVVVRVDVLVTEVPCDLKDPLEPADHEALEVEFGRDPQEEFLAEAVVERGERPGICPAVDRLEDRGLELEKVPSFKNRRMDHDPLRLCNPCRLSSFTIRSTNRCR